jgi:hypothetical protein
LSLFYNISTKSLQPNNATRENKQLRHPANTKSGV